MENNNNKVPFKQLLKRLATIAVVTPFVTLAATAAMIGSMVLANAFSKAGSEIEIYEQEKAKQTEEAVVPESTAIQKDTADFVKEKQNYASAKLLSLVFSKETVPGLGGDTELKLHVRPRISDYNATLNI